MQFIIPKFYLHHDHRVVTLSRHMNYSGAVVTGSVGFDIIMDFPSKFVDYLQPDKLHQINVSFVVDKLEKQLGGTATNISYSLSHCTKKPITVLAAVGRDGDEILNFFKNHHIKTDGILVDSTVYSATGTVITDTKDNQIWGYFYGASARGKEISLEKYATTETIVVIAPNHKDAFLNFMNVSIENKYPYLFDPGMSLSWISDEDLKKGIQHCEWLIGNDYEIAMVEKRTGMMVADLVKKGCCVITTLGEEGVKYKDSHGEVFVQAYSVTAHDPTGAGDAWRGGFVAALLEGKTLKEALIQGNVMASFAVEHYGTATYKPSSHEIEQRLQNLS